MQFYIYLLFLENHKMTSQIYCCEPYHRLIIVMERVVEPLLDRLPGNCKRGGNFMFTHSSITEKSSPFGQSQIQKRAMRRKREYVEKSSDLFGRPFHFAKGYQLETSQQSPTQNTLTIAAQTVMWIDFLWRHQCPNVRLF